MSQKENSSISDAERIRQSEASVISEPALQYLSSLMPVRDLRKEPIKSEAYVKEPNQQAAIAEIARTLFRANQRHAILVGEPGVGRTSVLHQFANALAKRGFPFLSRHSLTYFDVTNVGPEDSRGCLETIFGAISGAYEPIVLFLDGCTSIFRRSPGHSNKAIIFAMLNRPNIAFVGTMCHREYVEQVGNDAQMLRFFSRIDLSEPEGGHLQKIVRHAACRLSNEYAFAISQTVADRAVVLASTFILSESQPSKTINVMRRACDDLGFATTQLSATRSEVTEADLVRVVSERTRIPAETIEGNGRKFDYRRALGDCVLGQEDAVRQVSVEMQLIAAGLAEPNKPASVMMFAGTTGVGKTELAKRIAELYSSSGLLNVYPMGNFTEAHSVSGLVGVPAGYVGHEDGGRIVNDLLADPYSVFLLDEAEKCHPNVWKPFLNLFDEGWIVDQQGRRAYADRAIFILTTNAGDRSISQMTKSGKTSDEIAQQVRKTLSRVRQERSSQPVFPPQFLSRMRKIIIFNPLSEESMVGITQRIIERTAKRWEVARRKKLVVSCDLVEKIGRRGNELNQLVNGEEGGRIAIKLVRENIEHRVLTASMTSPDSYEHCQLIRVTASSDASGEISASVEFE